MYVWVIYQGVGGCHPPPWFLCIMRLFHMEYNFLFLSSCIGYSLAHIWWQKLYWYPTPQKKVAPEIAEVAEGGRYSSTP